MKQQEYWWLWWGASQAAVANHWASALPGFSRFFFEESQWLGIWDYLANLSFSVGGEQEAATACCSLAGRSWQVFKIQLFCCDLFVWPPISCCFKSGSKRWNAKRNRSKPRKLWCCGRCLLSLSQSRGLELIWYLDSQLENSSQRGGDYRPGPWAVHRQESYGERKVWGN